MKWLPLQPNALFKMGISLELFNFANGTSVQILYFQHNVCIFYVMLLLMLVKSYSNACSFTIALYCKWFVEYKEGVNLIFHYKKCSIVSTLRDIRQYAGYAHTM